MARPALFFAVHLARIPASKFATMRLAVAIFTTRRSLAEVPLSGLTAPAALLALAVLLAATLAVFPARRPPIPVFVRFATLAATAS